MNAAKKPSAPCSHRSARASPSFLYFAIFRLVSTRFPASHVPAESLRVCLRPVSLRPSLHFFISPDRFRARRLLADERDGQRGVWDGARGGEHARRVFFIWRLGFIQVCPLSSLFFFFCILHFAFDMLVRPCFFVALPPYLLRCHTSYLQTLHSFDIFYSQLSYFIFLTFFFGV